VPSAEPCSKTVSINGAALVASVLMCLLAFAAVELGADFRGIYSLCSECLHDSLNVCHEKRSRDPFAYNVGNAYSDAGLSEFDNVKVVTSHKPGWLVASNDFEIWELRNLRGNESALNLSCGFRVPFPAVQVGKFQSAPLPGAPHSLSLEIGLKTQKSYFED
jgi:hypothetical protein